MQCCKGPVAPQLEVRCIGQEEAARLRDRKWQKSKRVDRYLRQPYTTLQGTMDWKPHWMKNRAGHRDFAADKVICERSR